ncbi:MAG: hypothetical protein LBQ54_00460 [Planctomycetaceae bacterium]|jgi:SH3-like domain-containing protein|nr:hypothetical protein [Planctomycetaceae bacterium]
MTSLIETRYKPYTLALYGIFLGAFLFPGIPFLEAAENDVPFDVVVSGKNGLLRSGPGEKYYPTRVLEQGERLEVYLEANDQWYGVRPPEGSFTWVDAGMVRIAGNGTVGVIVQDKVPARIGSELGNMCGAISVWFRKGDKVAVFERVDTPADPETPVWYKIAPPAGEFRWVHKSQVTLPPEPAAPVSVTPSSASVQPEPETPMPLYTYPRKTAVPPKRNPVVQAAASQTSGQTAETPPPAAPQKNGLELTMEDFQLVFDDMKLEFTNLMISDPPDKDSKLESLAQEARMLYDSAPTVLEQKEINRFLAGIEKIRYQTSEAEGKHQPVTLEPRSAPSKPFVTPMGSSLPYMEEDVQYYDPDSVVTSPYIMQYPPQYSQYYTPNDPSVYPSVPRDPRQVRTLSSTPPQKKGGLLSKLGLFTSQLNLSGSRTNPVLRQQALMQAQYTPPDYLDMSPQETFIPESVLAESYMPVTPQSAMPQPGRQPITRTQQQMQMVRIPRQPAPTASRPETAANLPGGTASANLPFDVVGRLARVKNPQNPREILGYMVKDESGKLYMVTPPPGVDLEPYVSEVVGISGKRGMMQDSGFPHISATAAPSILR